MAIMGFGGGAMVGSPLAVALMDHFKSPTSTGVAETFVVMGCVYFALMMFGAATVRVPPAPTAAAAAITAQGKTAAEAIRTKDFWLIWVVLFTNVTAGIGILGQASPMIQEMFGRTAQAAAGFVGLLSLFNLVGRFVWSSLSDRVGRKTTYALYLGLGMVLYGVVPSTQTLGVPALFVAITCVILSMYGGGFATVPAYLRDLFGTRQVGAIHGRLLTAWSTAALVGPTLVTYARQAQIDRGVPTARAYSMTMYLLVGLLLVGFVANALVTAPPHVRPAKPTTSAHDASRSAAVRHPAARLVGYWVVVAVPMGWGVWQVAKKSMTLFL
jgi:MFS family permease